MTFDYNEAAHKLNGFDIYSREWRIKSEKGAIIVLHGYGEYSGRYTKTGNFFVNKGYNVFMPDLPGHGRSSGIPNKPRTYIDSMETYITTLNEYIDFVKEDMKKRGMGDLPVFFMGHSMGGLITSILSRRRKDLAGFISSAPAYIIKGVYIHILYYFFLILVFFFPTLIVNSNDNDTIFTNKEIAKDYERDDYVFTNKAVLITAFEMARYGWEEKSADVTVPFYLMHGSGDTLIKVEGAREKSKHLKNPISKYVEYPGANHVLLEEDNYEEMLIGIEKWVQEVSHLKE